MKIPPRCMFIAQFYGTILGGIVNYVVLKIILAAKRLVLQGIVPDPTGKCSTAVCLLELCAANYSYSYAGQWTGRGSSIFYASSIIYGAVGPARLL